MKTITPYVLLQSLYRYGVVWTFDFLVEYFTRSGIITFKVPGYGPWRFHARKGHSDVRVFYQVVLRRSYRLPVQLPPVRCIVDAGANVGYASLYFANMYPNAKVVAIEPDPANFDVLKANAQNVGRIECFLGALWPDKTRLAIQNAHAPSAGRKVGVARDGPGDVSTITISEIVERHGFIDILKMDIEGAEVEIFSSSNLDWLAHVRCVIIELHDFMRTGCSMAFYRAIAPRSFSQHISGENLIVIFESRPQSAMV